MHLSALWAKELLRPLRKGPDISSSTFNHFVTTGLVNMTGLALHAGPVTSEGLWASVM